MKRFALTLLLLITLVICSCSGGVDDSEIIDAAGELAPKAKALYEIVYCDGLPHGEADDTGYCLVDKDAEYSSISAIKSALAEVFTPEYSDIIGNTAFKGVESDEGYIGAKFMEREGVLYVSLAATEGFAAPREFDINSAVVKEKTIYMAVIALEHEDGDIEVTLQYMDGKWLIDSPIY